MAQATLVASAAPPPESPRLPLGRWGLRAAAMSYLIVMIAVPVLVINIEGFRGGIDAFIESVTRPAAMSAIWLSIWTAAVMAIINTVMGTLTAYVLVYFRFPGKKLLDSIIDLPFAIPTLVTGTMLVLLYGPQTAVGGFFQNQLGIRILFAPPGIILALLLLGYPFVIRAVQPVLEKMDIRQQEAAFTLGASSWVTFRRIILPSILPAMLTGALLSFARAMGEFGSIVIVSGNIPMKSQTAAVYIYGQVEGGNMAAASGVSVIILLISLVITLGVDFVYRRQNHA
ncbi:MAG TPA: sulfate ABC transporter permease subunit CysT [Phototrophicaceae bacterium]|nr:sulfate ABC transporter permease subunit CysT [Phototrophicaceae bacterium]